MCCSDGGVNTAVVGSSDTAGRSSEDISVSGRRQTGDSSEDTESTIGTDHDYAGSKRGKYRCEQCSYVAKHRHNLKEHIRVHTGEKPFKCGICCRAFSRKRNLDGHKRMHAGRR